MYFSVRDATARLPNGEGTRSEICELLKDSQYLAPITQESYLHSVVSGALDRLHYETDPCVKYDTKRKIWMYLHRARSEQEFGESIKYYRFNSILRNENLIENFIVCFNNIIE